MAVHLRRFSLSDWRFGDIDDQFILVRVESTSEMFMGIIAFVCFGDRGPPAGTYNLAMTIP